MREGVAGGGGCAPAVPTAGSCNMPTTEGHQGVRPLHLCFHFCLATAFHTCCYTPSTTHCFHMTRSKSNRWHHHTAYCYCHGALPSVSAMLLPWCLNIVGALLLLPLCLAWCRYPDAAAALLLGPVPMLCSCLGAWLDVCALLLLPWCM